MNICTHMFVVMYEHLRVLLCHSKSVTRLSKYSIRGEKQLIVSYLVWFNVPIVIKFGYIAFCVDLIGIKTEIA